MRIRRLFNGLFRVPTLISQEDRSEYMTRRVMGMIVFTLTLFLAVVLVIVRLRGESETEPVLILVTLLGVALIGWRISQGRHWRWARWLAAAMFIGVGVFGSLEGTGTIALVYYALAIMLVGLLAGTTEMVAVMFLSLALHFGIWQQRDPEPFLSIIAPLIAVGGAYTGMVLVEWLAVKLMDQALVQSTRDPLTGLYNRGYFDAEMVRMQRVQAWPVSVIVFDLNDLKIINDQYGHAAGDEIIVRAGQSLLAAFRNAGRVYRIGGDEFVALLPRTDAPAALAMLARLQAAIAEDNRRQPCPAVSLAAGLAVGAEQEQATLEELFILADSRMYEDKERQKREAIIAALNAL